MQIRYVKGVDLSPGEIEEATRRFAEHVKQRNPRHQGRSSIEHEMTLVWRRACLDTSILLDVCL